MSIQEELQTQVKRRKTFAIISHPDAGKTTLTEKLLLYGGAIRLAGSVKARKTSSYAVSDWMEIEKQRGISVTSSVMQFEYDNYCINILDTPGHQDFSEDTYRTLVAADSAVMIIDGAKGVEAQTIKLFQVCRLRGIPIFTFVNKMDRASKDPFELMEEIEKVLGIRSYPMNWPIGTDGDFKGIYNRLNSNIEIFDSSDHGKNIVSSTIGSVTDNSFKEILGDYYHKRLCDEIELLDMAGDNFDTEMVLRGELSPMFFGSAMTNFGVEPFLQEFLKLAPCPGPKKCIDGTVNPTDENFSAFIFKIQANMNPAHRDRIAFFRVCSGKFAKGMSVYQVRTQKELKLAQPQQFMAQERTIAEEAFPGDIIGIHDPGVFKIGDSLSGSKTTIQFEGIPIFPAEHFAKVIAKDTMKRKQFLKGITQISEEGAIQVFKQLNLSVESSLIIGTVGVLQFEVLEYRLKSEYGVDIRIQNLPHRYAMWIESSNLPVEDLNLTSSTILMEDKEERPVLLCENEWTINLVKERNSNLKLTNMVK